MVVTISTERVILAVDLSEVCGREQIEITTFVFNYIWMQDQVNDLIWMRREVIYKWDLKWHNMFVGIIVKQQKPYATFVCPVRLPIRQMVPEASVAGK